MRLHQTTWFAFTTLLLAGLSSGCETRSCGNGEVATTELCDDGNNVDGDGCSAACAIETGYTCAGSPSVCTERPVPGVCGDGTINVGELCDDGGESNTCNADCTIARCGDGVINATRAEACDDGNSLNGDGCTSTCEIESETCGDGVCDGDETCTNCMVDCQFEPRCMSCADADGDGFEDSACGGEDCNDSDPNVHPGATEVPCNRIDEDCSVSTPDALDEDMDGSSCNFDCDDSDPLRSPLFFERCGNELDDDCNPDTPDVGDMDGDGFNCDVDCNDFLVTSCPTCPEICDNVEDDDCDPLTPDVFDGDGDGALCDSDCDDADADVYPGRAEVCGNATDDDCDPTTMDVFDSDMDGDDCTTDCDDGDPTRATTIAEICGNLRDDDCDPATPDMEDADSDTFTCDVDCDDSDPAIVPDAMNFCGPRIMYFEDFEAGDGGWTAGGTDSSWAHGTPTGSFITAASSGTSAWVTNLSGSYNNSEMSYIESPPLDFSAALVDPILSFSHLFETEACCDEGWVEISVDGGAVFTKLGAVGTGSNWYNSSRDYWNGTSGSAGAWRVAQHTLRGAAGQADVRIRFIFSSDGSITREGFGVDDVRVDNQVIDMAVVAVSIPDTTCRTAQHPVAVTYRNNSTVPVTSFTASYVLDGVTVNETVTHTILPGTEYTYTFSQNADLSAAGMRAIQGRVSIPGDAIADNNSSVLLLTVADVPVVALGPAGYSEDFEGGPGGWTAAGEFVSWAHGMPAGTFIAAAASGSNAWVSNLTGDIDNDEVSSLTSGCFDFGALTTDPTLSFSHIFELMAGEGWIEVYTPGTGEWVRLGATGSGSNWYNSPADTWNMSSGTPGTWRTASHVLTGTAGQRYVRIRHVLDGDGGFLRDVEGFGFDDVAITP